MNLTVFQSDQGDCLLLTAGDGTRVLVDGGMPGAYSEHVAPALGRLREAGETLDLLYVSHVDNDHIGGVLRMLEDAVEWRVHDHQLATGNDGHRAPSSPRPPEIGELWNNSFHELVGDNAGPVEDMLAAAAGALEIGGERALAERMRDLAASIPQGITLARRAGAAQLGIPVNRAFEGRLAMVRDTPQEVELGALGLTVLGPFEADLRRLRDSWNRWLRDNQSRLAEIRREMERDADRLGTDEIALLRRSIELQGRELGDRDQVTIPNLASLMLLAREGERTVLLTGDGHADDILAGLEAAGALDGDGRAHVDVLKVQHHGAEHNIHADFCARVTADHYVFCGNGAHHNPELAVIDAIADARAGDERAFAFWFNSSAAATAVAAHKAHMKAVEARVAELAGASGGRLAFEFLDGDALELEL